MICCFGIFESERTFALGLFQQFENIGPSVPYGGRGRGQTLPEEVSSAGSEKETAKTTRWSRNISSHAIMHTNQILKSVRVFCLIVDDVSHQFLCSL